MARGGPTSQAAIDALAELKRSPRRVVIRAIEHLEAGLASLDEQSDVPAGWFLSTASGYATTRRGRVPGDVALADAAKLIETLSTAVDLHEDELADDFFDVRDLQARWNVAERTLLRYRARGLAGRRVRRGRTRRLVFAGVVVEAFEARQGSKLSGARAFSRMNDAERRRAITSVGQLQAQGIHTTAATRTVAAEMGRSAEAIRQLIRADASDAWTARQKKLVLRAHDRFLEPADVAERVDKDATSTRRMIDVQRLHRLRSMGLEGAFLAEPPLPRMPLGAPGPTYLADLIAEMREAAHPDRAQELELTAYARFLTTRAARTIDELRIGSLRAEPIDAAETDLLWATRLRVEALRPLLGYVLRGLEARLGCAIEALPARTATAKIQLALAAAAEAAHRYDPARGGRLSAAVTIAVDRSAGDVHRSVPRPSGAKRSFGQATIEDWTRRVSPWQPFLEAPPSLRAGLAGIPLEHRTLLEARFGLGERPHTLAELSTRFSIHRPWVARRLREAARSAIEIGRRRTIEAQGGWHPDTIGP